MVFCGSGADSSFICPPPPSPPTTTTQLVAVKGVQLRLGVRSGSESLDAERGRTVSADAQPSSLAPAAIQPLDLELKLHLPAFQSLTQSPEDSAVRARFACGEIRCRLTRADVQALVHILDRLLAVWRQRVESEATRLRWLSTAHPRYCALYARSLECTETVLPALDAEEGVELTALEGDARFHVSDIFAARALVQSHLRRLICGISGDVAAGAAPEREASDFASWIRGAYRNHAGAAKPDLSKSDWGRPRQPSSLGEAVKSADQRCSAPPPSAGPGAGAGAVAGWPAQAPARSGFMGAFRRMLGSGGGSAAGADLCPPKSPSVALWASPASAWVKDLTEEERAKLFEVISFSSYAGMSKEALAQQRVTAVDVELCVAALVVQLMAPAPPHSVRAGSSGAADAVMGYAKGAAAALHDCRLHINQQLVAGAIFVEGVVQDVWVELQYNAVATATAGAAGVPGSPLPREVASPVVVLGRRQAAGGDSEASRCVTGGPTLPFFNAFFEHASTSARDAARSAPASGRSTPPAREPPEDAPRIASLRSPEAAAEPGVACGGAQPECSIDASSASAAHVGSLKVEMRPVSAVFNEDLASLLLSVFCDPATLNARSSVAPAAGVAVPSTKLPAPLWPAFLADPCPLPEYQSRFGYLEGVSIDICLTLPMLLLPPAPAISAPALCPLDSRSIPPLNALALDLGVFTLRRTSGSVQSLPGERSSSPFFSASSDLSFPCFLLLILPLSSRL